MEQTMNDDQGPGPGRAVFLRLSPQLSAALDAAAAEAPLSRAGWVRRAVVEALTRSDISDLPSLPPSPPRRPATIPQADLVQVSNLAAAIARTGGAVVQLAKSFREGGHPLHGDVEDVLADLRVVQADVARLVGRLNA